MVKKKISPAKGVTYEKRQATKTRSKHVGDPGKPDFNFLFILFLLMLLGCEKNPCNDVPNVVYQYPDIPKNHTMTIEEVDKFVDLPKEIAECITTDNLIESILTYPYISLIFAGATSQSGYELVKRQYRGLSELESRTNRGKFLLQKYQSRDPLGFDESWDDLEIGYYMCTGVYLEVVLSQYINLRNLDTEEFKNMFLRSLEVYDLEKTELEHFGYLGLTYSTTTLARMMLISNYEPFVSLYNTNVFVLNLTEEYGPANSSTIELIHEMALEYSKKIKN